MRPFMPVSRPTFSPFSNEGWLRLTTFEGDDELRLFGQLPAALHRGEASCLAIAAQRKWAFLTDDARAPVCSPRARRYALWHTRRAGSGSQAGHFAVGEW